MRHKLFVCAAAMFVLAIFLYAPMQKLAVEAGWITMPPHKNYILPERTHSGFLAEQLNRVEEVKASVADTYTNYLPGYGKIVAGSANIEAKLNRPAEKWLGELAQKAREEYEFQKLMADLAAGKVDLDSLSGNAGASGTDNTDGTAFDTPLPSVYDGLEFSVTAQHEGKSYRDYKIEFYPEEGDPYAFLDRAISIPEEELQQKAQKTVDTVNHWSEITEELGVNLYFYMATRLQDTPMSALYFPDELSTEKQFRYVLDNVEERVQTDYLRMNSLGDRLGKQFLSDHHWTAKGSYEGYQQIVAMMQKNYADFGDPIVPVGYHTLDGVIYCGYYSLASWDYFVWDTFAWYDYGLRDFAMSDGNSQKKSQELYLAGKHENNPNGPSYHYESFHGITHHIHNQTSYGRKLLIIGDSFLRPIGEPLSSHYDDTYFIHYWEAAQGVDLEKYLTERGITDVLLVGTSMRFVGDLYDDAEWEMIY